MKKGDIVICTSVSDFDEEHLTIGKKYEIEDTDSRFVDRIVVKSDNGKISMFFDKKYFNELQELRGMKIDIILE